MKHMAAATDARFDGSHGHKDDKMQYRLRRYFTPHGSAPEHPALAGFIYDPDYMSDNLLPAGAE